jgi:hypothetical protein
VKVARRCRRMHAQRTCILRHLRAIFVAADSRAWNPLQDWVHERVISSHHAFTGKIPTIREPGHPRSGRFPGWIKREPPGRESGGSRRELGSSPIPVDKRLGRNSAAGLNLRGSGPPQSALRRRLHGRQRAGGRPRISLEESPNRRAAISTASDRRMAPASCSAMRAADWLTAGWLALRPAQRPASEWSRHRTLAPHHSFIFIGILGLAPARGREGHATPDLSAGARSRTPPCGCPVGGGPCPATPARATRDGRRAPMRGHRVKKRRAQEKWH